MKTVGKIVRNPAGLLKLSQMGGIGLSVFTKLFQRNETPEAKNLNKIVTEKLSRALKHDQFNSYYITLWNFLGSYNETISLEEAYKKLRAFLRDKNFRKALEVFCELCSVRDDSIKVGHIDLDVMCDELEVYLLIEGEKFPKNRIGNRLVIDALGYMDFYQLDRSSNKKTKQTLDLEKRVQDFELTSLRFEICNLKEFQVSIPSLQFCKSKDFQVITEQSRFRTAIIQDLKKIISIIESKILKIHNLCDIVFANKIESINHSIIKISEALLSLNQDIGKSIKIENEFDGPCYDTMEDAQLKEIIERLTGNINLEQQNSFHLNSKTKISPVSTKPSGSEKTENSYAEVLSAIKGSEQFNCLLCKELLKAESFSLNCKKGCKICNTCRPTDKVSCKQCNYQYTPSEINSLTIIDLL